MKFTIKLIVIAIIIAAGGTAVWWFGINDSTEKACPMDAKLCSDGSYVGRVSPDCEFRACLEAKGVLKGKVTIGPLCPVEPCPATVLNPYTSRTIILQKSADNPLPPIALQKDGSFETEVIVGTYLFNLSDCDFLGCRYSLPRTVNVKENETTEFNVNIDTGIR